MDKKEILLQKLLTLLDKTDGYLNEITALKKEILDLQKTEKEIVPDMKSTEAKKPYITPVVVRKIEEEHPVEKPVTPLPTPIVQVPPVPVQQPMAPVFQKPPVKKKINVEKYIGENLVNKIGIAVLVLGIAFFVKYAIDKNWINEVARMWIGILCGFILCGFAFWLRNKYKAFSSVLTGGGISVFYFTFLIAFREYAIIGQATAFVLMIITTMFTVFLSVWYQRRELAVIAIVGGFASPLMVSTGMGNYIVFFSYLFILDAGMMVLSYFKKWNEINIISYIFTVVFFGSWLLISVIIHEKDPYMGAFFFGTLFYLLFFATNIINAFKADRKFGVFEIIILTSNTFLYYIAGMIILNNYFEMNMRGLFTTCLGVFNLGFAWALLKNKKVSVTLRYFLLGFGVGFISLIAPVQFEGNFITLFWAIELVLLYWLSEKSGLVLLKIFSFSVLLVLLISLLFDWVNYYGYTSHEVLAVVFNKAFLTGIFVTGSLFTNIFLVRYFKQQNILPGFSSAAYRSILNVIALFVLFIVLILELAHGLNIYNCLPSLFDIVIFSFVAAYLLGVFKIFMNRMPQYLLVLFSIAIVITHLLHIILSLTENVQLRNDYLFSNMGGIGIFMYHYLNVAIVVAGLIIIKNVVRKHAADSPEVYHTYLWYFCFVLLFIASVEFDHLCVLGFYSTTDVSEIMKNSHMIGYPIIWGIASLLIMINGLRQKNKMLRIISLTIFGIIILKLFVFDIRYISAGGKVAAFVILGVIMLLVSFLYQKLKKIVFGDDQDDDEIQQTQIKPE